MTIPDNLHGYHLHIYYDEATEATSIALHDRLITQFGWPAEQAPIYWYLTRGQLPS